MPEDWDLGELAPWELELLGLDTEPSRSTPSSTPSSDEGSSETEQSASPATDSASPSETEPRSSSDSSRTDGASSSASSTEDSESDSSRSAESSQINDRLARPITWSLAAEQEERRQIMDMLRPTEEQILRLRQRLLETQEERTTRLAENAARAAEAFGRVRDGAQRASEADGAWTWVSQPTYRGQVSSHTYRTYVDPNGVTRPTNNNLIGEENNMPEENEAPAEGRCRCGAVITGPNTTASVAYTSGGSTRCTACTFQCQSCYNTRTRNSRWGREVAHPDDSDHTRWFCTNCVEECPGCGETGATQWMVYYEASYYPDLTARSGRYCRGCMTSCPNCSRGYQFPQSAVDNYDPDEYDEEELCCHRCGSNGSRGIIGYQHTVPFVWLGGPVKAQGGYYLGFELEISARNDADARPIHKWAKKHLGHRDALQCKTDSSVRGFEIVSQPMTPEFFESVDWESLFDLLNDKFPIGGRPGRVGEEPREHGLHVHIGRNAFHRNDLSTAAFSYLLSQGDYLDKIARRDPYHYCEKVQYPVRETLSQARNEVFFKQRMKAQNAGIYARRGAINLGNDATVEIRAFKSTRKPDDLRAAMRVTYMAAEYIRHLRADKKFVPPKALHWSEFLKWAGWAYPDKAGLIITPNSSAPVRQERTVMVTTEVEPNSVEFQRESVARAVGTMQMSVDGQSFEIRPMSFVTDLSYEPIPAAPDFDDVIENDFTVEF